VSHRKSTASSISLSLLLLSCARTPSEPQKQAETKPQPVKITQFYPASPAVPAGSNVTICYGVENAVQLTLMPPVEELKPAMNRCFEAPVPRATEFRLTARGAAGDEVSASFTVSTAKAAPRKREPTDPMISSFTAEPPRVAPGAAPVKLCYQAVNAESVTVEPRVANLGAALMGCFYAPTSQTTTYVLTAHGKSGKTDVKRVTVTVP
jgi:hypothetical protein